MRKRGAGGGRPGRLPHRRGPAAARRAKSRRAATAPAGSARRSAASTRGGGGDCVKLWEARVGDGRRRCAVESDERAANLMRDRLSGCAALHARLRLGLRLLDAFLEPSPQLLPRPQQLELPTTLRRVAQLLQTHQLLPSVALLLGLPRAQLSKPLRILNHILLLDTQVHAESTIAFIVCEAVLQYASYIPWPLLRHVTLP